MVCFLLVSPTVAENLIFVPLLNLYLVFDYYGNNDDKIVEVTKSLNLCTCG